MLASELIKELEKRPDYELVISVALLGGDIEGIEVNEESKTITLHDGM